MKGKQRNELLRTRAHITVKEPRSSPSALAPKTVKVARSPNLDESVKTDFTTAQLAATNVKTHNTTITGTAATLALPPLKNMQELQARHNYVTWECSPLQGEWRCQ